MEEESFTSDCKAAPTSFGSFCATREAWTHLASSLSYEPLALFAPASSPGPKEEGKAGPERGRRQSLSLEELDDHLFFISSNNRSPLPSPHQLERKCPSAPRSRGGARRSPRHRGKRERFACHSRSLNGQEETLGTEERDKEITVEGFFCFLSSFLALAPTLLDLKKKLNLLFFLSSRKKTRPDCLAALRRSAPPTAAQQKQHP